MRSRTNPSVEEVRSEIAALAADFRRSIRPALEATLRERLEVLSTQRGELFDAAPDVREAFRLSISNAITHAASELDRRLSDEDIWLSPLTAPGLARALERDHGSSVLAALVRRLARRSEPATALGELDDPSNRIWLAVLSAVRVLDPVLSEYGVQPSATPSIGGGHYGLHPRSLAQLDPSGTLSRLWKRYHGIYERYAILTRERPTT